MAKNALKTVTKAEQSLVETLFRTGSLSETAKALGISEQDIRVSVTKPYMREILLREYGSLLIGDLGPKAIQNMRAMLRGEKVADRNMIALCKLVLDRIGQPLAGATGQESAPLESMSIAELQAYIAEKERTLPDITPQAQQHAPQTIDYLD